MKNAKQKNEEITAEEETQKGLIMKLETSRQEVTSDSCQIKECLNVFLPLLAVANIDTCCGGTQ